MRYYINTALPLPVTLKIGENIAKNIAYSSATNQELGSAPNVLMTVPPISK